MGKRNDTVIPYVTGTSEKLRRIFNQHHILIHFKLTNTMSQKLIHSEDKTPRNKQSDIVYAVQCSRTAQICTSVRQNNLFIHEWHNIGGPTAQVQTLLSTYIWRRKSFPWGQQCECLVQRRQMVWKRSKRIHLCQTGTTAFEQKTRTKTSLITTYSAVLSSPSITTIHTWANLHLATHMKIGWVKWP